MSQSIVLVGDIRVVDDVDGTILYQTSVNTKFTTGTLKIAHGRNTIAAAAAKSILAMVGFSTAKFAYLKSSYPIDVEINDSGTFDIDSTTDLFLKGNITQLEAAGNASNISVIDYIMVGE